MTPFARAADLPPEFPHFTSKERDTESGLDYFFARYYTSDLARFMSPDWAGGWRTLSFSALTIVGAPSFLAAAVRCGGQEGWESRMQTSRAPPRPWGPGIASTPENGGT